MTTLLENKEQISLITQDNVQICANYYNNASDEVVIIAPGWCMTKDSKAFSKISEMFAQKYDVLCFDFRGHGKSSGAFTFTAKELRDIDAVIKFAKSKNYKKIHLAGFSLGGSIVLLCAAENKDVSSVIAVSPPSDFSKIENRMWKKAAWYETLKKFELDRFLSLRFYLLPLKKKKPIDFVDKITVPTLFIAGENDPTVYPWHTKKLYDNAVCKKDFKLYKNGFHAEDLFLYYKKTFSEDCLCWLDKVC